MASAAAATNVTSGAGSGRDAQNPAEIPPRGWKQVALRTWAESSDDNIGLVSAGVAFYAFLAMVPLLGATVLTYGLIADPQTVSAHIHMLASIMPKDAAQLVGEQLLSVVQTSGGKKGFGLLLAIAIALFGARNAAGSMITALNIAYEEKERRSFLRVNLLSLAITAAAVVGAILASLAITALGYLDDLLPNAPGFIVGGGKVLSYVLLVLASAAAAATLYRYGPDRDEARWVWITPGTIFAAVGSVLLTLGFGFYVANFGSYNKTYGSLATVVILVTWMYLCAYVLLFGAELNSELEHQTKEDTTAGTQQPLGTRGAWSADHVAGDDGADEVGDGPAGEHGRASLPSDDPQIRPNEVSPSRQPSDHPLIASRFASHVGALAGGSKVGLISSVLSTIGLSMLRRKGREATGAALLAAAIGVSLIKRRD